ncbi:flagellin [Halobacteria archaeon AArc-m2/3/4]|uniref:Flagellin n=1 Tax=Natronoglomus mannanivorans TaxID=2979990 RepID=A0ABT2QH92_9EURY|nr:flagellin [Halobacteria archaeon AArc-m2/3/4]
MLGNTTQDETDRGQVGIGTLIVFIAMVLVAAIAAGVLINTAGSLQSQASDTGTETQQAVANQVEVVHAVGITAEDAEDNKYLSDIDLTIKKSAGSDVIDLTDLTVQYTSTTADRTLSHANVDLEQADLESFATALAENVQSGETSSGGDVAVGTDEGESLTSTEDRVVIRIDVSAIEESFDAENSLSEGESATVNIVDQSGAQYSYGVTAPATFGDKTIVVV